MPPESLVVVIELLLLLLPAISVNFQLEDGFGARSRSQCHPQQSVVVEIDGPIVYCGAWTSKFNASNLAFPLSS